MASINLSGILKDPTGEVAVGDQIRFTHRTTTGDTIKFARSVLIIPPDGAYDIDLEFGNIFIEYLDVKDVNYKNLGIVTVNQDSTATDLPALLNAIVPPTDAQLLLFQGILADTTEQADNAEASAAAALVSENAAALSASSVQSREYATLAAWQDDTSAQLDDVATTAERTAGFGGGATGDIIASGTENGLNIVAHGTLPLSWELRPDEPNPIAWGAIGNGIADDDPVFLLIEATGGDAAFDLNGNTYLVDAIPQGKKYINGSFKVGAITSPAFGVRYNGKVELAGLQPERVDQDTLRIFPGYCSDGATPPTDTMILNSSIDMDLTTNGLNGLDTGVGTVGEQYFVYILKNPDTGEVGAVVSKEISVVPVTKPAGFTLIRKLPFGFIWLAADGPVQAGIPSFHLAGWPSAIVTYTDMDDGVNWEVLTDGVSTALTTVDFTPLMPDNAREVLVHVELESTGSAGIAALRTAGGGGSGKPVGYVPAVAGAKFYGEFFMRVTSSRALSYKTASGTKLTLRVAGYAMTERS